MNTFSWKTHSRAGSHFAQALADDPKGALLAFDFDGTLAHMNPDPQAVFMVEESAAAIEALAAAGVKIALISGRPLEDLLKLGEISERPGFSEATLLGQYGIERFDVATGEKRDPAPPSSIENSRPALEDLVARYPGSFLEDKGRALAIHLRQTAEPEKALAELEKPVRDVAEQFGLVVEPGRHVWEVRSSATDKGDALAELVTELRPNLVMMAGDDLGDIAAFDYLDGLEDVGVCKVVSRSEEQPELAKMADIVCDGPDGLANWLTALVEHVQREAQRA